jgi:L-2,4-diaminobutyrate transaminase
VVEQLERRHVVENAATVGAYLGAQLHALAERQPYIGDVRGIGMLWGLEFVLDRDTREPFPAERPLVPVVLRHALKKHDLILRGNRSILQLSPPLVTTTAEIDDLVARLERAIEEGLADLGLAASRPAAVPQAAGTA